MFELQRLRERLPTPRQRPEVATPSDGPMRSAGHQLTNLRSDDSPIQRMIGVTAKDGWIAAKGDGERPPGSLSGGSQGEHTTPYTTLEHSIVNAINGVPLAKAWKNLVTTHTTFTILPGYEDSAKWLRDQSNENLEKAKTLDPDSATVEDIKQYANTLITIRNRIAYSSLPTPSTGTIGGKNEAGTAGALQYLERQIQLGNKNVYDKYTKADILITMWQAFDHTNLARASADNQAKIIRQHAITVLDTYWRTAKHYGVTYQNVIDAKP